MSSSTHWHISSKAPPAFFDQFPEIDPVFLQLFWNRDVKTQEAMDVFLGPDWSRDVHDPFLFKQMRPAVDRVFEALKKKEVITIHGDYDADGVCGAATLFSALRDICRTLDYDEQLLTAYIPHREHEGYGYSANTAQHLHEEKKTRLVITVDCGISNNEAIAQGKKLGMDTIVCDHHAMPEILPAEAILIHPLVPGETYPNPYLCGCGVAFKFTTALLQEARVRGADIPEGHEKWLLDLVAIATVTDMVPLRGENRVLEKYGLLVLNKTKRVGLQELMKTTGSKKNVDTVGIGFQIGPRINAAGRINHASQAFELLLEEEEETAKDFALRLDQTNRQRQKQSDEMYREAKKNVGEIGERKLLVIVGEDWLHGLVGLPAGKLCQEFGLPVLVVSKKGEGYSGSGRSIEAFNITDALREASDYLDRFGGHPQACGFSTIGTERFEKAVKCMSAYATEKLKDVDVRPRLLIETEVSLHRIDWSFWETLQQFEPFGQGNPLPVFLTEKVIVVSFDIVGSEGKHLRVSVMQEGGKMWKLIGFNMGERLPEFLLGALVDIVYEVGVNEWNGNRELQLRLVDFRTSSFNAGFVDLGT